MKKKIYNPPKPLEKGSTKLPQKPSQTQKPKKKN